MLGGRVRLGGEVSGTIAPEDLGWFNYSDYEVSTLRLFRVDLAAEARLASFASVLFDVRSDNLAAPRVYALYLRLRPWAGRELDLQAGLVPPVFGAFPRRRYASDNPLPSLPLAYQYLTNLREDAVPSRSEELVAQRGDGWRVRYPVGSTEAGPGLPLVNAERWDAGVQASARSRAARRSRWPSPRGRSATRGCATTTTASRSLSASPGRRRPRSWRGSRAPWASSWPARCRRSSRPPRRAPTDRRRRASTSSGPTGTGSCARRPCGAGGACPRSTPPASRSRFTPWAPSWRRGTSCGPACTWRPGSSGWGSRRSRARWARGRGTRRSTRVEAGAGFAPWRHVLLKASWQHNWRDGGAVEENDLVAGQVVLWF